MTHEQIHDKLAEKLISLLHDQVVVPIFKLQDKNKISLRDAINRKMSKEGGKMTEATSASVEVLYELLNN